MCMNATCMCMNDMCMCMLCNSNNDGAFLIFFIINFLEKRQTVLFSATQTRNVEDLARISLKKAPLYVGVDDDKEASTVDGLEQVCCHGNAYQGTSNYRTYDNCSDICQF